jgi:nickel/cobalt transporter (NiCoT) family protein
VPNLYFSRPELRRLGGLYAVVALLHGLGWGLYLHFAAQYPALVGLGLVAYLFGLRHAFDADHIAAIDDTVRYMLQKGQRPLGVGLFFSLGHSTIVMGLALAIAFAATAVKLDLPQLRNAGGVIGTGVSGVFLWIIGMLNLLVLFDILKVWREARAGRGGRGFSDTGVSGNLPVQYSNRRTEIHEETKTEPLGGIQGTSGPGGDPG